MPYAQAKNTPDTKYWTINTASGFQPTFKESPVGITHKTLDAAQIFIACQIAYNTPQAQQDRQDTINQLYQDFDTC